jgi:hypothetical protein
MDIFSSLSEIQKLKMHRFKMFWDTIGCTEKHKELSEGQVGYGGHGEVLGHQGGGQIHQREQGERLGKDSFFRPNYEDSHVVGLHRGVLGHVGVPSGLGYMDITEGSRVKLGCSRGTWTSLRAPGPCLGARFGTLILKRATGLSWGALCGTWTSRRGPRPCWGTPSSLTWPWIPL